MINTEETRQKREIAAVVSSYKEEITKLKRMFGLFSNFASISRAPS